MRSPEKLQFARQKLLTLDIPFHLRVVSYLRISCLVLKQQGLSYSELLQALYKHDTEWWKKCKVTFAGGLYSDDLVVYTLLRPINDLHQTEVLLAA